MSCQPRMKEADVGHTIKRRKLTASDDIFTNFHANKSWLSELENSADDVFKGNNKLTVCLLKIKESNARSCLSFKNASCDIEQCECRNHEGSRRFRVKTFALGTIFRHGIEALTEYISDPYNIPSCKEAKTALSKLLHYWPIPCNDQMALEVDEDYTGKECEWTLILAQHLLSELTLNKDYKVDNGYTLKGNKYRCPCPSTEVLDGTFSDTSAGLKYGWHGSYDLVLNDEVPVATMSENQSGTGRKDEESDLQNDLVSRDVVNVNVEKLFNSSQLISQCIIFSFLQRKMNPDMKTFLIPMIGISTESFIIYFYDCENDLLLQTPVITYMVSGVMRKSALLVLWLALNYKYFCSGLTKTMLSCNFKADFSKRVDNYYRGYKEEIESPCHALTTRHFEPKWGELPCEFGTTEELENINDIPHRFLYKQLNI